jgi:hypothetical protein
MTTFTTEDRLVAEAPYHPGYEDAVIGESAKSYIDEYLNYKNRHVQTSRKIVEFIKARSFGRC